MKILKQDYTPDEISAMEKFAEYEPPLDITLKDQTVNPLNDGQVLFTGTVRMPSNVKVTELPGYEEGNGGCRMRLRHLPSNACLK